MTTLKSLQIPTVTATNYNEFMENMKGKKIALLVDNVYQELEVWYPLLRFREAGANVITVGATAGQTYTSKLGYPVKADVSYDEAKASDFDGVVIPGGFAPDHIRRHPKAIEFVRAIDRAGKLVAAICHGPWVLCSSGSLNGKRATSFFSIKDDVVNAGAKWEDAEVVVDDNLVTSRKPEDLPAFCRASMEVLTRVAVRA
jgi:protease I